MEEVKKVATEGQDDRDKRIEELEKELYTLRQNLEECEIGFRDDILALAELAGISNDEKGTEP